VGGGPLFFSVELETVVGRVVGTAGLELVEVTFRREGRGRVLRVTVDRRGGVDLDAIAETSERLSRRLDAEGFAPGPYTLEVSSPGVERPLRRPEDFVRSVGEKVRLSVGDPAEVLTGKLAAADEDAVTVATETGDRSVSYADITGARTLFEWGARPGNRPGANAKRRKGRRGKRLKGRTKTK
jgi:ribosome maturation factor RimP